MPTIDEILAAMPEPAAEGDHEYLVIDPVTRTIFVPEAEAVLGVTGDDVADRKYFICPRYVGDNLDLAGMFIRVNFRNANGEEDGYLVDDVAVSGEYVTFSWLLTEKVTAYKGTAMFGVCADLPNTVDRRMPDWNTTMASAEVLEGLDPDLGNVEEETSDVVTQLRAETAAQTAAVTAEGAAQIQAVQSEGATQVNTVKATGTQTEADALAAIEAKGEAVRASIPEDYTTLASTVDRLTHDRAAAIVCGAEGETVQVSDASADPLQGLRIFGKTEQVKTTGAQLIPYPYFNGNKTHNGVTWKVRDDGSVDVRGTATDSSPLYLTDSAYELAPGQYTISGSTAGVVVRVDASNRETGAWVTGVAISKNGVPVTFTITEEDVAAYTYTVYASVESGSTASATIHPMLNAGPEALPWEPYSGGVASPSPAWAQELQTLPAPVVSVHGRNLFNLTSASKTVNGVTFTINEDKSVTINGTAEGTVYFTLGQFQVPPGEYYLSGCTNGGASHVLYFQKVSDYTGYVQTTTKPTRCTIFDRDPRNMMVAVYAGHTLTNVVLRPMLRLASDTDDTFEPYTGQTLTVITPDGLPGIPVTSGGNYTDANGQQWICDEVDLVRGVYVQRIQELIVDGNSDVVTDGIDANPWRKYVWLNHAPKDQTHEFAGWCNKLPHKTSRELIAGNTAADAGFNATSGHNVIYFNIAYLMEEDTVEAAKAALEINPLTFKYVLSKAVETALTTEELQAFRALHSNKPATTVLNDAGAWMAVEYAADPKLYIDRKIAELVAVNN